MEDNKDQIPTIELSNFIKDTTEVFELKAFDSWKSLTNKEKSYAYHLSKACWAGWPICVFQRSFESPALIYLILTLNKNGSSSFQKSCQVNGISQQETKQIKAYFAAVLQNCGNYKSFGDCKFLPEFKKELFDQMIKGNQLLKLTEEENGNLDEVVKKIIPLLYNDKDPFNLINYPDKAGTNAYYSANFTSEDGKILEQLLKIAKLSPINTRGIKLSEHNYQVRVASVNSKEKTFKDQNGNTLVVKYGEFAEFLKGMVQHCSQAKKYAANPNQEKMLNEYAAHFAQGDIQLHKQSQRAWIKDVGPIIQTNLGFIQTYVDPQGVRAEYQGFVAIVDKEISAKFTQLVNNADQLISELPWGPEFEKETFQKPDFTDLKIITFANSDCPIGINIPNYDDIRMNDGFKNVNLGNAYGKSTVANIKYLYDQDAQLLIKWENQALTLIVALHQLLGHGSGKLFTKNSKTGKQNFPQEGVTNPIDGSKVTTFYEQESETWTSKFGSLHSSYQECRADTIAMYLMNYQKPFEIFLSHLKSDDKKDWDDIFYVAWLDIILGAFKGMQYYDINNKKWLEAHVEAGWVIIRVLLLKGDNIVEIQDQGVFDDKGEKSFRIKVSRQKLRTSGFEAVKDFLRKLHIYKAIGQVEKGVQFFKYYAKLGSNEIQEQRLLKLRDIVVKNKNPRRLLLQANLKKESQDEINYISYEQNFGGIIDSFVKDGRLSNETVQSIYNVWKKDSEIMNPLKVSKK